MPLEPLRFHDMLSFLLRELMDDGVGGSSIPGAGDLVDALEVSTVRGPFGFLVVRVSFAAPVVLT